MTTSIVLPTAVVYEYVGPNGGILHGEHVTAIRRLAHGEWVGKLMMIGNSHIIARDGDGCEYLTLSIYLRPVGDQGCICDACYEARGASR